MSDRQGSQEGERSRPALATVAGTGARVWLWETPVRGAAGSTLTPVLQTGMDLSVRRHAVEASQDA
jgi:hypothetical protein